MSYVVFWLRPQVIQLLFWTFKYLQSTIQRHQILAVPMLDDNATKMSGRDYLQVSRHVQNWNYIDWWQMWHISSVDELQKCLKYMCFTRYVQLDFRHGCFFESTQEHRVEVATSWCEDVLMCFKCGIANFDSDIWMFFFLKNLAESCKLKSGKIIVNLKASSTRLILSSGRVATHNQGKLNHSVCLFVCFFSVGVLMIKTCGSTWTPEFPPTGPDRTRPDRNWSGIRKHFKEFFRVMSGIKILVLSGMGYFLPGYQIFLSKNFGDKLGIKWKPCLAFPV